MSDEGLRARRRRRRSSSGSACAAGSSTRRCCTSRGRSATTSSSAGAMAARRRLALARAPSAGVGGAARPRPPALPAPPQRRFTCRPCWVTPRRRRPPGPLPSTATMQMIALGIAAPRGGNLLSYAAVRWHDSRRETNHGHRYPGPAPQAARRQRPAFPPPGQRARPANLPSPLDLPLAAHRADGALRARPDDRRRRSTRAHGQLRRHAGTDVLDRIGDLDCCTGPCARS